MGSFFMTFHLPFLVRDVCSVETVKMFLAKKKKLLSLKPVRRECRALLLCFLGRHQNKAEACVCHGLRVWQLGVALEVS